jgi:hypothetical protein
LLALQLGRTPDELLDTLNARHLQQYQRLYEETAFGAEGDNWRTAMLMSAMNGNSPAENLPKWELSSSREELFDLGFANVCRIFTERRGK